VIASITSFISFWNYLALICKMNLSVLFHLYIDIYLLVVEIDLALISLGGSK
jgi:hypothetical protein